MLRGLALLCCWLPAAAAVAVAPAIVSAVAPTVAPAIASPVAPVVTGQWVHALAAYGTPKYPAGYSHVAYVNPDAPKGGELHLSNPDRRASFDKFNPFTIKGVAPAALEMFMFERLCAFTMDEAQSMYGLLAEAMYVEPDLSAITFRLRPEARFADGTPLTAEDVADSFRRLKGKLVQPRFASPLAGVDSATVLDARSLRFTLKEHSVDTLFGLGWMPVFSHRWGNGRPLAEIVTEPPITSGPYVIEQFQMPGRIRFKRNPQYWAQALPVRRGHFNFDHIDYRFYQDEAVRREAFKAGEFDLYREQSAGQFARSHQGPKWRDGRIVKRVFQLDTGSMLQAFDFNLRLPKFQDIRVREAIATAWDFDTVNRYGSFMPADSLFSNSGFAAQGEPSADELKLLEPFRAELPASVFGPAFRVPRHRATPGALRQNLKHAAAMLAQAGWTIAPDGLLRNARGEAFTIDYIDPTRVGRFPEFVRNLGKLGITFNERLVDYALFRRRVETYSFDIMIIVEGKFTLPSAGDLRAYYGSRGADSPGSDNYRGVRSRAVDALIEQLAQAQTLDELRTAARALDRVVMWNHWQVPMLYSRTEPTSYWNRFGIPAVQARYFQIDSMPNEHSQPWPLWTWWDRALAGPAAEPPRILRRLLRLRMEPT